MADINSLTGFLGDVANAIREKDGIVGNIYPKDYDNRIRNISTGSIINGLYSFSFRQGIKDSYDEEISQINTSSVQNLRQSFYGCKNLKNISEFDMSNVKGMNNIFYGCSNLTNNSLCNICNMLPLYNNITDSTKTQRLTYLGLTEDQIANIPEEFVNIAEAKGWTLQQLMEYIISYDNGNGNILYSNLEYKLTDEDNKGTVLRRHLCNVFNNQSIIYNLTINNTDNIQNWVGLFAGHYYFYQNAQFVPNIKLQTFPICNFSNMINGSGLFQSHHNNLQALNFPDYDFSNLQDASNMFYETNLKSVPSMFFSTYNLTKFSNLFRNTKFSRTQISDLENIVCNYEVNLSDAFAGISSMNGWSDRPYYVNIENLKVLKEKKILNLSNFLSQSNMSIKMNISNLSHLNLSYCTSLQSAFDNWNSDKYVVGNLDDLNTWHLNNCKSLGRVFNSMENITGSIPNWNVGACRNFMATFQNCKKLTGSIPNWNVTTSFEYKLGETLWGGIFENCYNLTGTIPNWNLCKCTDISRAFSGCNNLTGSIPNWNLSKCQYLYGVFNNCTNLTGSIPNWDLPNICTEEKNYYSKIFEHLFENCVNLTGYFPNFNLPQLNNVSLRCIFKNCFKLTGPAPLWIKNIANICDLKEGFYNCTNLTDFYIINNCLSNNGNLSFRDAFYNCYNLSKNAFSNIMYGLGKYNVNTKIISDEIETDNFFEYIGLTNNIWLKSKLTVSDMSEWGHEPYKTAWPNMQNIITAIYSS